MNLSNSVYCSHTIVYVAMKSRFRSPLWCDTSSTRVTSGSQISQSATVNLIHCLVIPCAIPVLTRGAQFWIIPRSGPAMCIAFPESLQLFNIQKSLGFYSRSQTRVFFKKTFYKISNTLRNLVEFTLEKKNPKISLFFKF